MLAAVLAVVTVAGYVGWSHFYENGIRWVARGDTKGGQTPVIPVTVAQAQTADFAVYLNGLGTVQPYETVTVHSRVDGELTKVAFKQGQMVSEGELLAQIDPREKGAGRSESEKRAAQSAALYHPQQRGILDAPAA
jgi:multidrug efflux system membrane fusion protein